MFFLPSERRLKYFLESEDRDELSYTQTQYYYYNHNASGSGLSESDVICTVNIPLMVTQTPKTEASALQKL